MFKKSLLLLSLIVFGNCAAIQSEELAKQTETLLQHQNIEEFIIPAFNTIQTFVEQAQRNGCTEEQILTLLEHKYGKTFVVNVKKIAQLIKQQSVVVHQDLSKTDIMWTQVGISIAATAAIFSLMLIFAKIAKAI